MYTTMRTQDSRKQWKSRNFCPRRVRQQTYLMIYITSTGEEDYEWSHIGTRRKQGGTSALDDGQRNTTNEIIWAKNFWQEWSRQKPKQVQRPWGSSMLNPEGSQCDKVSVTDKESWRRGKSQVKPLTKRWETPGEAGRRDSGLTGWQGENSAEGTVTP